MAAVEAAVVCNFAGRLAEVSGRIDMVTVVVNRVAVHHSDVSAVMISQSV